MSLPVTEQMGTRELTVRGVLLGGLITLLFTAANTYMGLKVGLTFATSIPAAVISMAVLHMFKNHSIQENNIVQTVASAAGTLSAIVFVLPGLIMVGWWNHFPYWTTLAICAIGGILGVMYSIPLRRALVTGSDLPYPEGVAAAEVLKVGDTTEGAQANKVGIRVIIMGSIASALYLVGTYLGVVKGEIRKNLKVGNTSTYIGAGLSMALMGVGHLVGLTVGIAMLVGVVISYGFVLPWQMHGKPIGMIDDVFAHQVRFVGAGTMAIAAVWTLLKILGPIIRGIKEALVSHRKQRAGQTVDLTERDLPMSVVLLAVIASLIPIGLLLWDFLRDTAVHGGISGLILVTIVFILLVGLLVASICGYMAGLIGASNSPVSGVGILVVILTALIIRATHHATGVEESKVLVAYTLFTAAIIFGMATISNDNLQDLKTGQLVGATPWKQQVALIIGVIFGSAIIPPVLSLMHQAFGFQGAPGADPKTALAAPQAGLMSSLAQGVFGGNLEWNLIGLGVLIGVGAIIVDELLGHFTDRMHLSPLAVGMGMYLPIMTSVAIPIGALLGVGYDRWAQRAGGDVEGKKRTGVLLATGLIVGEAIMGVIYAGVVVATGNGSVLDVVGDSSYGNYAEYVGLIVITLMTWGVYSRVKKMAVARENASTSQ